MKLYTVGEVNKYISNIISNDYLLKKICIRGEITNYKQGSTEHIFFALKDDTGIMPAVMYGSYRRAGLDFEIANGQAVECVGYMGVYEQAGKYQYYVTKMKKAGDGELAEKFEILKRKLSEEGLFDFENKKRIPKHPKTVGLVTSEQASALQDVLSIAKRRNPYVQLILYNARVQGRDAVDTVVAGIKRLDSMGLDTIIVCRGGGSIEELWTYNEEKVVRAIYEAKTPIISAIGHEDNVFLSDYAADLRAATPSAACELAIPDVVTTIEALRNRELRIKSSMQAKYESRLLLLQRYRAVIDAKNPVNALKIKKQKLLELQDKLRYSIDRRTTQYNNQLSVLTAKIHGLSPTAKLVGGFGYIEKDNRPVTTAHEISVGDELLVTVNDGTIKTKVTEVTENNNG